MTCPREIGMDKKKGKYIKKAIAMEYFKKKGASPRIVAKGKGVLAEKIIALAEKSNVPLFKDKILCDMFMKAGLGKEVPEILYRAAAEVLAYVYWLEHNRR